MSVFKLYGGGHVGLGWAEAETSRKWGFLWQWWVTEVKNQSYYSLRVYNRKGHDNFFQRLPSNWFLVK